MSWKLERKVTLVTGGGSGIGKATALAFVREGAIVIVADFVVESGEGTTHEIKEGGGEAIFIQCDVTRGAEVKAMVDKIVKIYGRLDCAFNNAGIHGGMAPTVDYPEENWNRVIGTNLTGVWLCMKYEIAQMLQQGSGTIVNTASVGGLIGTPGLSAYIAAKHGVIGITKTAALEYAKAGIRVNAVCPGVILTPMADSIEKDPELKRMMLGMHPVGRFGTPDEVAGAVVWLCSDSASFVTGHAMAIDGGLTAI